MLPSNADHTRWSHENANLVLQEIKRQVVQEFRDRDERNSGGALSARSGYKTTMPADGGSGIPRLVANPALVAVKHSGRDVMRVVRKRWLEFCAVDQDEQAFMVQHRQAESERLHSEAVEDAKALEESLVSPDVPEPSKPDPGLDSGLVDAE